LFRRQASEQYFTSAQFLAQRRRQLMGRPQPSQGLLGKAALLPRKEGVRDVMEEGTFPLELSVSP
jgi:hypothetical protein